MDVTRLDRDAVRRVLRRAVALEGDGAGQVPDAEGIDADSIVAAAIEAGIPESAVRRSLAMERLGPPPTDRDGVLGAAVVVVTEEVAGDVDEVLGRVDAWLVSGHHMRRDRLHGGTGAWTRRRGVLGSTFRSLRRVTGEGYLGDLERIDVVAVECGSRTCVVRVAADRRHERRVRGATGAAVATVTTAGVVLGAVALGPLLLLAAPVTVAAGTGIAASGRHRARRVADEIDRVLDSVDHRTRPTRLAPDLAKRVVRPGRYG